MTVDQKIVLLSAGQSSTFCHLFTAAPL